MWMQKISLRIGVLALIGIILFFSIGGISAIISNLTEANDAASAGTSGIPTVFGERDSLTILIIKENDARSDIEYCTLVRFDPADERVLAVPVPADLFAGGRTLRGQFSIGGEAQCALVLGELLGADKIYYSAFTYAKLRDLLNKFGGVTIDLKYIVNYKDPIDPKRNINAAPSKRKFGGGEAARLLNWPEWPGGETEHMMMYTTVWATLINEQLTVKNSLRLPELYNRAYNNSFSNVSTGAFQNSHDGLVHLADLNTDGKIARVFDSIWPEETDGRLEYAEAALEQMRALFGSREGND